MRTCKTKPAAANAWSDFEFKIVEVVKVKGRELQPVKIYDVGSISKKENCEAAHYLWYYFNCEEYLLYELANTSPRLKAAA